MAASRKEAFVIGGFLLFFAFALLIEKIGFKGSNSNMYLYLEENRKNNESKWWKSGENSESKLDVLEPHHSLLEQFNLVH